MQTEEHKDQLADHVSESFVPGDTALTGDQTTNEPAQETALEEERIKDEIEIQIDLLKDPDWAVRREAVITLGEMGDERCVDPRLRLCKTAIGRSAKSPLKPWEWSGRQPLIRSSS